MRYSVCRVCDWGLQVRARVEEIEVALMLAQKLARISGDEHIVSDALSDFNVRIQPDGTVLNERGEVTSVLVDGNEQGNSDAIFSFRVLEDFVASTEQLVQSIRQNLSRTAYENWGKRIRVARLALHRLKQICRG